MWLTVGGVCVRIGCYCKIKEQFSSCDDISDVIVHVETFTIEKSMNLYDYNTMTSCFLEQKLLIAGKVTK